ncbi:hypothetical protein BEN47_05120 [Hymenobacter lapidarius]|uniref:Uncharacterized protein n=1 Tax=Hymenobacter lapidarius TaxID=1908237 RepID=A0A1G1STR3_9BACT|nr:hypothetical protein [Hymenobacter lapidarius]OGX82003.1 hypothetical protein BEN47_05120 [Hymenobacter lapidarius]
MDFQEKKYTFRGMDGFAGFRHGQAYELELRTMEESEDRPAEVVMVNPVSRLHAYCSKEDFNLNWKRE